MAGHFPMLIPGATSDDGALEVQAPYDGSVIATVTAADREAIERLMQTPSVFSPTGQEKKGLRRHDQRSQRLSRRLDAVCGLGRIGSGGVGGIPYTMKDMQIEKLMVLKSDGL